MQPKVQSASEMQRWAARLTRCRPPASAAPEAHAQHPTSIVRPEPASRTPYMSTSHKSQAPTSNAHSAMLWSNDPIKATCTLPKSRSEKRNAVTEGTREGSGKTYGLPSASIRRPRSTCPSTRRPSSRPEPASRTPYMHKPQHQTTHEASRSAVKSAHPQACPMG